MAKAKRQSKVIVFVGQYQRVVDAQGRVRFPAEWRSIMGGNMEFFVMVDPNKTK